MSGVDRLLLVHLPDRRGLVSEGMRAVERWVGVTYASQGSLAYWSDTLPLYDKRVVLLFHIYCLAGLCMRTQGRRPVLSDRAPPGWYYQEQPDTGTALVRFIEVHLENTARDRF